MRSNSQGRSPMLNPYLLLWFEAPLQSWGFDSKFGRRDTLAFPTRSGVLGLICCALGAGGEQRELLSEFYGLGQTVISFVRAKKTENGLQKIDKEPTICDFQMVGSGYDDQNPWEVLLIPKTSEGKKPAMVSGAKMTYRYYLQDAAFAVVLEVPGSRVDTISAALEDPVWDLYLGRKNCVPTDFIYRGTFAGEEKGLKHAASIAESKGRIEDFRVVSETSGDERTEDEMMTLNDVPERFGPDKRYRDRQVRLIHAG